MIIPVTTPSFAVTVFLYRRPRESEYEYVCALRLARPANLPPRTEAGRVGRGTWAPEQIAHALASTWADPC